MADPKKIITKVRAEAGQGQSQVTKGKGTTESVRKMPMVSNTSTDEPVTVSEYSPETESSQVSAGTSEQVEREDIGIDVTFKFRIKNFLGGKNGC